VSRITPGKVVSLKLRDEVVKSKLESCRMPTTHGLQQNEGTKSHNAPDTAGTSPRALLLHHAHPDLTLREARIAAMLAEGMTNGQCAEALGISVRTVDNHTSSLRHKLHVPRRVKLRVFLRNLLGGGQTRIMKKTNSFKIVSFSVSSKRRVPIIFVGT